jgi:hypothetical protein
VPVPEKQILARYMGAEQPAAFLKGRRRDQAVAG